MEDLNTIFLRFAEWMNDERYSRDNILGTLGPYGRLKTVFYRPDICDLVFLDPTLAQLHSSLGRPIPRSMWDAPAGQKVKKIPPFVNFFGTLEKPVVLDGKELGLKEGDALVSTVLKLEVRDVRALTPAQLASCYWAMPPLLDTSPEEERYRRWRFRVMLAPSELADWVVAVRQTYVYKL